MRVVDALSSMGLIGATSRGVAGGAATGSLVREGRGPA